MEHPCGQLKIDFINQMGYFVILMQTYYAYTSPPLSQSQAARPNGRWKFINLS
jgi:hypothetical protein